MKKILNGKKYDTAISCSVGNDSYSNPRDFNYWEETLYQKKNGEFFLYGEGGPLSRYREEIGTNSWTGGERIIPMTREEAMEWAEEHLTGDEFEDIFGEIEE